MKSEQYGEDYYEHGITTKTSGYEHYRYMPTRSYEEATTFSDYCYGTVLDWGCAKGYLVHALRQLGNEAFGYDPSEYAVANCHPPVKDYLFNKIEELGCYDTIICKDVMEHVPEEEVLDTLKTIRRHCNSQAIFVIPLGDNDMFRIREYELDKTHVTKKDEDWWIDKLREAGFKMYRFEYSLGGVKKKWQSYEYGNGFFMVKAV